MSEPKKIIIGSETEYGIAVYEPDGDSVILHTHEVGSMVYKMIGAASSAIFGDESRVRRGEITSVAQHNRVEKTVAVEDEPPAEDTMREENKERGALMQRLGYSGLMLPNGARFYSDMEHPEYSAPETTNPLDALVAQKAGDVLVRRARDEAEKISAPLRVAIYKNNSFGRDDWGVSESHGAHENYSLSPHTFMRVRKESPTCFVDARGIGPRALSRFRMNQCSAESLADLVALFFVARQIITGAGKVGFKDESVPYQISQRADFIQAGMSEDTTEMRGIINLRDRPYANPDSTRRLHMIIGDSNMSQLSLYMKFGMTGLFMTMLESGFFDRTHTFVTVPLKNPVQEFQRVSRDMTLTHRLEFVDGTQKTALEVMHEFAECAETFVREHTLSDSWSRVVPLWKKILLGLERGRNKDALCRNLDWVAKELLLQNKQRKLGVGPCDDACREIDLEYHSISENGLFFQLEKRGWFMDPLASEDMIKNALHEAPQDTRAWLRGELVRRYGREIDFVRWDRVYFLQPRNRTVFMGQADEWVVLLPDPFCGSRSDVSSIFSDNPNLTTCLSRLRSLESSVTTKHSVRVRPNPYFIDGRE